MNSRRLRRSQQGFGEQIAVAGALDEGDQIAVRGAESLTEGADVKILMPETASIDRETDEG